MTSVFILSFDFEMAWGTRVDASRADHAAGVEATHALIPQLLSILDTNRVSATWATVGHLMLEPGDGNANRALYGDPAPAPSWFRGAWHDGLPDGDSPEARRYYAPDAVRRIVACPTPQELASHTFTHPQLSDDECPAEVARHELLVCRRLAERFGREVTSLVFPRNRVGNLAAVADTGHNCYRGLFDEWYRFGSERSRTRRYADSPFGRGATRCLRLVDEWLAVAPRVRPARVRRGLCEIPHGMFFPGSVGLSRFVPGGRIAAKAIKGLERCADRGGVFSLFTHPHNFLPHQETNLGVFRRVIEHAATLRNNGRIVIRTMAEHAAATLGAPPSVKQPSVKEQGTAA